MQLGYDICGRDLLTSAGTQDVTSKYGVETKFGFPVLTKGLRLSLQANAKTVP
jgi:hypothetical protein